MTERCARVVKKVTIKQARDGMGPVVLRETAATLLQREHAAVRMKVKAIRKQYQACEANGISNAVCDDLLAWLDERGR